MILDLGKDMDTKVIENTNTIPSELKEMTDIEKIRLKSDNGPLIDTCLEISTIDSTNLTRHSSLPDISSKKVGSSKIKECFEDLKEIFQVKSKASEYDSKDICAINDEDTGARAKSLHSGDVSDKSKSSTESSSISPCNEEIWHLADNNNDYDSKYEVRMEDVDSAHITESDSFGKDGEKGVLSKSKSETFSFVEAQRAYLESRIGIETLLKVYRLVADLEQKSVDEKLDYRDFQNILGPGNEDLIDNIIQLVVADSFFTVDQT